jgi:phosphopantothenoylcysteine decarboxylase / phosphopantothenate---cysteine ligase
MGNEPMKGNNVLTDKQILLGVSGGVAAYKAVFLASRLTQSGARVDVVMTEAATRFVTPLSFEAVTQRRVYCDPEDMFSPATEGEGGVTIPHIHLAHSADLLLIAPATANTLARLAHGFGDTLLTALALASPAPVLIAPAMETHMWQHPATQANIATLVSRGAATVGPDSGHLASGAAGPGRMSEPEEIHEMARIILAQNGIWAGKRVIVSAGGTREAIDPVRFVSNHSSGKMGYAQAIIARDLGADVTLVTAPTALPDPIGVETIHVESAEQMKEAIIEVCCDSDVLVMAAAVADYKPVKVSEHKIKKLDEQLTLEMARTTDILREVAKLREDGSGPRVVVGFAAETEKLIDHARAKLRAKHLDLIVANDVTGKDSGFEADTNRVTLLWPDGKVEPQPLMSKYEVARTIYARIEPMLEIG